jgi:hypothetical protein
MLSIELGDDAMSYNERWLHYFFPLMKEIASTKGYFQEVVFQHELREATMHRCPLHCAGKRDFNYPAYKTCFTTIKWFKIKKL